MKTVVVIFPETFETRDDYFVLQKLSLDGILCILDEKDSIEEVLHFKDSNLLFTIKSQLKLKRKTRLINNTVSTIASNEQVERLLKVIRFKMKTGLLK